MPHIALYGHARQREQLASAADSGALPSSLLLLGARGVGKQRLAIWLAQRLLCASPSAGPCGACQSCRYVADLTHPDLHWVFPRERARNEGQLDDEAVRAELRELVAERAKVNGLYAPTSGKAGIFVSTVHALVRLAALTPSLGTRKVIVVGDAERMVPQASSPEAANAFLKLLEEPPDDTTIILTSSEPGALLPTIRSRVVSLRVPPLTDDEVRAFLRDPLVTARLDKLRITAPTEELVRRASGAPGRLFEPVEGGARERAERLLDAATRADRAAMFRVAYAQGVKEARGDFTDTLDSLTDLLHDRMRDDVTAGRGERALATARAVDAVEHAKARAQGNLNPQLIAVELLGRLTTELS